MNEKHQNGIRKIANYDGNVFLPSNTYHFINNLVAIDISVNEIISRPFYCFSSSKFFFGIRVADIFRVNLVHNNNI